MQRVLFLLLILGVFICGAPDRANALLPLNETERMLDDLFQNAGLGEEALFGAYVVDRQTGERLVSLNETHGMSPASLVKLFTSAAALDVLGPDHRFRTSVDIAGEIDPRGTLYGQILIRGGGDPGFGPRFQEDRLDVTQILRTWAKDLRAIGISHFEGTVIGDERLFIGEPVARGWDPVERAEWWSAEVSALTFNDGCISIQWDANRRVGAPARYTLIPTNEYMQFTSTVRVVPEDNRYVPLRYFRHSSRNEQVARGNLPRGMRLLGWTAVEDPARFTAQLLAREMREAKIKGEFRGVSTRGYPASRLPEANEVREVLSYTSPPLTNYIEDILADSQNLYAECIARAIAIKTGKPASFEGAAEAITQWADSKGMMRAGFALMDGSGLSGLNMLSPRSVGDLLLSQRPNQPNGRIFRDSLAVAGKKGTLQRRMENLDGRFIGKTGVLKEATTLAGYLLTRGGREYAVVLMIDNSDAPVSSRENFLDSIVEELDIRLSTAMTAGI